jgi:hypothetical protein
MNHENDGLIFTKVDSPYKPGRDFNIVKWKPPHLNTIDFLMVPNEKFDNEGKKNLTILFFYQKT